MKMNERKPPRNILYNESLQRRLKPLSTLRPKIEEDLLKAWAGYHGECKVDRFLSTIDNKEIYIIHDLTLQIGDTYFQIDTLILSKSFGLILEIKNIAGHLSISTDFGQVTRTLNGEVTGFTNPIEQAKRYRIYLLKWLRKKKFPPVPIDFLVVFTNPSSVITSTNPLEETLSKTIRLESLVSKFLSLQQYYKNDVLSEKEIKKISQLLLKENTSYTFTKIKDEFVKGVFCTNCKDLSMTRKKGSWFCTICGHFDKNAHVQAIHDYFELISPFITTKEASTFLKLDSHRITRYLLSNMNQEQDGKGKATQYSLNTK
jgi:Nuclease-related domain